MRNWFPGTQTLRSSLDIPLHLQSSLIPSWVLWLAPVVVLLVSMNTDECLDLWLRSPHLQFLDVFPFHVLHKQQAGQMSPREEVAFINRVMMAA